ncbi:MAG TPA: SAM-dependent chlorinase/fluorinase [Burkholderiales bacterium]|nr:SAM-dependent chlorinase/fluorinase [Burkholderiales bacterium]
MPAVGPIFLFTDFGSADIYVGQVKAVLQAEAPTIPVVDLFNDAAPFDIESAAHLLAALAPRLPRGAVTLAVVDPGVGSPRAPIALTADSRWFVGPDNGLVSVLAARARASLCFPVDWLPAPQSVSFHGRDLFAPAAAHIARGSIEMRSRAPRALDVELGGADCARVIYVDHYGNAMTGVRARAIDSAAAVSVAGRRISHARVFCAAAPGELFWYENSLGLLEIAANAASAASLLGIDIGEAIALE